MGILPALAHGTIGCHPGDSCIHHCRPDSLDHPDGGLK